MRTKNKKWTVPILAIVPVLALAAFLVVSMLTPDKAQARDAGECGFDVAHAPAVDTVGTISAENDETGSTDTDDDECTVLGDSVMVTIENMDTNTEANVIILISGGSDYAELQAQVSNTNTGEEGVDEITRLVPKQTQQGRNAVPGTATFEVTSAMADSTGVVVLAAFEGSNNVLEALDDDPPTWPVGVTQTLTFVGAPAIAFDADKVVTSDYTDNADEGDINGSLLRVTSTAGITETGEIDDDTDGYDDRMWTITDDAADTVTIVATILDAAGHELNAGDKDSTVMFSIDYVDGSDVAPSALDYTERVVMEAGENSAELMVDGWKDNDNAVKVVVSATYTGPTAPDGFNLGMITLTRAGDPSMVDTDIYAFYGCVNVGPVGQDGVANTIATDDTQTLTNSKCETEMRFGREQMFIVSTKVTDALGSTVTGTGANTTVEYDKDVVTRTQHGTSPDQFYVYMVAKEAALGMSMLTVEHPSDDVDDEPLMFYVAGPPIDLAIGGDANIALNDFGMFTVTATDMIGGVPHITDDNNMVTVAVQPSTALVVGVDTSSQVKLDDEGTASFIVYAALDAEDGDHGRIIVRSGDLQDIQPITFGAPAPEMTAPGMPMNVMATADDMMYNTINVSWEAPASDGNSAITGYMVERGYMDADNMMTWMTVAEMTTDMMYMDTGLMAETKYYYRVTAMNSIGSGMASDGMAMATTGVAPAGPMAYGMLDAVMLTVGDDAHMVDVSGAFMEADGDDVTYTAMSDNDMVATASADGSMVSIMAVGAGSATVTVTATDKDGSATQDISVTVSAAPVASYAIAVPDRIEAGMTGTITVTAQDANGNATAGGTVTVSLSDDDDMVTAIGLANNNQLELGSDGEGSFRIFANADATSGSVTITLIGEAGVDTVSDTVRIGPNQNPMAGDAIADVTMTVGDDPMKVATTFTDAEDDMLSYSAMSDDEMVATAMVDMDGMVTITAVGAGSATITVTGMDTEMGSGMQTIMVTVKEPNTAPMAGDAIADQMVYVGAMVEVQSNFSDPDEDMLSYMATSEHDGREPPPRWTTWAW